MLLKLITIHAKYFQMMASLPMANAMTDATLFLPFAWDETIKFSAELNFAVAKILFK